MDLLIHPVYGPDKFWGRETLLRTLLQGIRDERTFAVVGGPKAGRTSTMLEIEHRLRAAWTRDPEATRVVPIVFDLANARDEELPKLLWEAFLQATQDPHILNGRSLDLPRKIEWKRREQHWEKLNELLTDVWKQLRGTPGWYRPAWLIDNADGLLERHQREALNAFSDWLRDEAAVRRVGTILFGGRGLREALQTPHDALKTVRTQFLGAFDAPLVGQICLRALGSASQEQVKQTHLATGGHPYLLTCYVQACVRSGQWLDPNTAFAEVGKQVGEWCESVWQTIDFGRKLNVRGIYASPEHALMQFLLEDTHAVTLEDAETELQIKPLRDIVELLTYLGVVQRHYQGDQYTYACSCTWWNQWYREHIRGR